MKIFAHNFNPRSNSGPNKFTRQLFNQMQKEHGVSYTINQQEADVEFCLIQQVVHKVKPMVLRLDGIWFNSEQNYKEQNKLIDQIKMKIPIFLFLQVIGHKNYVDEYYMDRDLHHI